MKGVLARINQHELPILFSSRSNYGVIGREITFITYGKDIKAGSDDVPLYKRLLTLTTEIIFN